MSKIAKDSFTLIFGRGIGFLISVITPIILVRAFTVPEYGEYRQIMLIITTVAAILPLGMINSLYYFFPHFPDEKQVYLSRTVLLLFFNGLVFSIFMLFMGDSLAMFFKNRAFIHYDMYIGIATFLFALSMAIETILIIDDDVKLSSIILVITRAIRALTVIVCAFLGGPLIILYGLIFFFGGKAIFSLIYFYKKYRISIKSLDIKNSDSHIRYAVPLGFSGLFILLSEVSDKFIVSNMLGKEIFAVYAVGCYELPFIAIIFGSIGDVVLPKIVELKRLNDMDGVIRLWHSAIKKSMLIGIPVYIFFLTFADIFITTVFTSKYSDAVILFRISISIIILESLRYGMITRGYARTKFMFIVTAIGYIIMLPACILGTYYYQMIGAITSVIITRVLVVLSEITYSKYILSCTFRGLLPYKYTVIILLLSVISAIITFIISLGFIGINNWIRLFTVLIIFISVYSGITLYFKFWKIYDLPFIMKFKKILRG